MVTKPKVGFLPHEETLDAPGFKVVWPEPQVLQVVALLVVVYAPLGTSRHASFSIVLTNRPGGHTEIRYKWLSQTKIRMTITSMMTTSYDSIGSSGHHKRSRWIMNNSLTTHHNRLMSYWQCFRLFQNQSRRHRPQH